VWLHRQSVVTLALFCSILEILLIVRWNPPFPYPTIFAAKISRCSLWIRLVKTLGQSAMKLLLKYSNVCDHSTSTSQTDKRTIMCANTALCVAACSKKLCAICWPCISLYHILKVSDKMSQTGSGSNQWIKLACIWWRLCGQTNHVFCSSWSVTGRDRHSMSASDVATIVYHKRSWFDLTRDRSVRLVQLRRARQLQ